MPSRRDYPKDFDAYLKPFFFERKPKEILEGQQVCIKVDNYSSGDILEETDKYIKILDTEDDDGVSHDIIVKTYSKEPVANPHYLEELEIYSEKRKAYLKKLKEWKKLKARWEQEEKAEKVEREKAEYLRLKEKYERQ